MPGEGDAFAQYMTSTAGGTQGSSSYSNPSGSSNLGGNDNDSIAAAAVQNFQDQQEKEKNLVKNPTEEMLEQANKPKEREDKFRPLKMFADTFNAGKDFLSEYGDFGGFGGLLATPFKLLAEPTEKTFKDPKTLAQLALLFEKNKDNPKFAEEYINDHGDLIKKVFEDEMSEVDGMDTDLKDEDLMSQLQNKMDAALKQAKTGFLGKSSQYSTDPVAYYEKYPNLNQTTTQLNDLAKLDAKQFPALADKIFAARAELDRMGKNPFGTGGSSIPGGPGISSAYNQGGGDSGSGSDSTTTTQDFTTPDLGPANIVFPDAQETVPTSTFDSNAFASNSPLQNLLDSQNKDLMNDLGATGLSFDAVPGMFPRLARDGGIMNAADGVFAQIEITKKPNLPLTLGEIKEAKKKYEGYQYDIEVDGKTRSYNFDEKLAPSGIETLRKREGITPFDTGLDFYGGNVAFGNTPEAREALKTLKSIDPSQPGNFHMQGGTALNYKNMGGIMEEEPVNGLKSMERLAPNFNMGI
jgi:hypothetical protein